MSSARSIPGRSKRHSSKRRGSSRKPKHSWAKPRSTSSAIRRWRRSRPSREASSTRKFRRSSLRRQWSRPQKRTWSKVTSLIGGIAGLAQVQIGNLVGPTSVLTSVSQVDPLKAYFTVSEQQFTEFHRRFPTEASVVEQRKRIPLQLILPDGSFYERTGTIFFADRDFNPATGAIRIAG